ncbi:MATE family efflux transporter [Spongorhabdus nitratireducens]
MNIFHPADSSYADATVARKYNRRLSIPAIVRLSAPGAIEFSFVVLTYSIDAWFISKIDSPELAALGIIFPFCFCVQSFQFGMSNAVVLKISGAWSRGSVRSARKYATYGLLLTSALAGGVLGLGLMAVFPYLYSLLQVPEDIHQSVLEYLNIWLPALFVSAPLFITTTILRAAGMVWVASLLNIINTAIYTLMLPFFITQFGIRGAALSVLSNSTFMLFVAVATLNNFGLLTRPSFKLKYYKHAAKLFLPVALPASISILLEPLSAAVIAHQMLLFGSNIVAGYGIGARLELIAFICCFSLRKIFAPYLSYNLKRKQYEHIKRSIFNAVIFIFIAQIFICLCIVLFSTEISQSFSPKPEIQRITTDFLSIVPFGYIGQGLCYLSICIIISFDAPVKALIFSFVWHFFLVVGFSWALGILNGYQGALNGIFVGNSLAGVISLLLMKHEVSKKIFPQKNRH